MFLLLFIVKYVNIEWGSLALFLTEKIKYIFNICSNFYTLKIKVNKKVH